MNLDQAIQSISSGIKWDSFARIKSKRCGVRKAYDLKNPMAIEGSKVEDVGELLSFVGPR